MAAAAGTGLTEQQQRAIAARGVSVALSAGAGCGKTFALTERFLAALAPDAGGGPARLDQLTAITFTERAAREMRDRIRDACTRRLIDAPEAHVDHWLRLVRQLDAAQISTIHSFCGSLLRAHAVEAGVDPRFQVLDQAQADTILFELTSEELRQRLAAGDEAVIDLVVQFGLGPLGDMAGQLLARRQEIDWLAWRAETSAGLVQRWEAFWREESLPRVAARIAGSPEAAEILDIIRRDSPSHSVMRQRCDALRQLFASLGEGKEIPSVLETILENARVQGGGTKKNWASEADYNAFRDAAAKLRDSIKAVKPLLAFDAAAALGAAETALRLTAVAEGVAAAYEGRKRELAAMDFNDLLIRARELLRGAHGAELRKRLAAQTRLLLVDEFQDTDPLQVELVKALLDDRHTDGKLFFVGDFKQSIYRFRGADPEVFRQLRQEMPEKGRMSLTLNFRSQPAVLDFVNALFGGEFADYEPLRAPRERLGVAPGVEFLWATAPEAAPEANAGPGDEASEAKGEAAAQADDDSKAERIRRREAEWIARRLREIFDSGEKIVCDGGSARAVRPGDVALLFRALTNVEYYEDALRRAGIDYCLVGGRAFYAQQEIFDVVNLLRAVANPSDEVSLLGALRSPFFSLLDETLYWLSRHPEGLSGGLFAERPPAELDGEQARRTRFAAETLAALSALKDRVPIAHLLQECLARTGYDAVLLGEFLGSRKLANLNKLVEQARGFDQSGALALDDFITRLAEFIVRQPVEPLAATQPENVDVVRLMSIHQAKGLEFPVVVVPDVDRRSLGPTGRVAFTPRLGPMVNQGRDGAVGGYELFRQSQRDEEDAELVRLLYVAATRAGDYLILSSGLEAPDKAKGPWTQLIWKHFDPWTGAPRGGGDVRVRVTANEPPPASKPVAPKSRRDIERTVEQARTAAAESRGVAPRFLEATRPDGAGRRQYSFSRLSGRVHPRAVAPAEDEEMPAGPATLDPLGLGTLVHAVLAEADFARIDDVPALVRRHALRHLPEAGPELAEPIAWIERFLASERGAAIAAATEVHREIEFLLAWPPDRPDPEGPYLQGFIDCLYRDASNRWRVIDYKTNRVEPGRLAEAAANYEMQMYVYALAVKRILGEAPAELTLCFLRPALEHHFPWDAAARRGAAAMVDEAIRAIA